MSIQVGDRGRFGRPKGEKTLAEVVRVNTKTIVVKQLEERGTQKTYPVGHQWKIDPRMWYSEGESEPSESPETKKPAKIVVGTTTFRHAYADSNALWKVVRKEGEDIYRAYIIDNPDYGGVQDVFDGSVIRGAIQGAALFDELRDRDIAFGESLSEGDIVHHSEFRCRSYVRCQVVRVDGQNQLRPIALVGQWHNGDLPRRNREGEIFYPHKVQKILEGKPFTPNYSTVYESPDYAYKGEGENPAEWPEIDLTVPEMTEEEVRTAEAWKLVSQVQGVEDANPFYILDTMRRMLVENQVEA